MILDAKSYSKLVKEALAEDIGDGDITTERTVPSRSISRGEIMAKEAGILAGMDVVREVYRQVDGDICCIECVDDGARIESGLEVVVLSGPTRGILTAERTALNVLQRLSGIATLTRQYVDAVAGTGVRILDTRKTTPGLRMLEKYAVHIGGGENHRMGLYDMMLIKDNHLQIVGDVKKAVELCKQGPDTVRVEVEVRDLADVKAAVEAGADRIMLDNMSPDAMKEAVSYVRNAATGAVEIEASGRIDLTTVRRVAETGVDYISVGALTHSSRSLDMAFYLR